MGRLMRDNPNGSLSGQDSATGAAQPCPPPGGTSGVPPLPAPLTPLEYFGQMVAHCYEFAEQARREGRPMVGIMCEFTPRELILAAGAVPVCLCGGSAATIPAAEQFLPANLCPLIKSTFGYAVARSNPFLEWADLVIAETTCDGKKKMFEVLQEWKPMYVLELPQKSDDVDAFERWVVELRKLKEHLEARFGVKITQGKLVAATRVMNRERALRRQLAELMTQDPPPLTGRQLLDFKSLISGIDSDLAQYERALELYQTAQPEATRRGSHITHHAPPTASCPTAHAPPEANQQPGSGLATRNSQLAAPLPRILLTGVPLVHGAERVLELLEGCGAVVVCMENCTGLKPILEDVDLSEPDPIRAIARKYYHLPCSVMTANQARFQSLRTLSARFRPDCVVEVVWQACLTYDIESLRVRRLVEDELHLPYLKLTTDYSPADSGRITARVEALLEIVRQRAAGDP